MAAAVGKPRTELPDEVEHRTELAPGLGSGRPQDKTASMVIDKLRRMQPSGAYPVGGTQEVRIVL